MWLSGDAQSKCSLMLICVGEVLCNCSFNEDNQVQSLCNICNSSTLIALCFKCTCYYCIEHCTERVDNICLCWLRIAFSLVFVVLGLIEFRLSSCILFSVNACSSVSLNLSCALNSHFDKVYGLRRILGVSMFQLKENFEEEASESLKHPSQYARNLLEYCCFRALALSIQITGYLDDKKFRRLTFDTMVAWEFPAASSQPSLNVCIFYLLCLLCKEKNKRGCWWHYNLNYSFLLHLCWVWFKMCTLNMM